MRTYKLSRSVQYNGKEYTELNLDLAKLTGKDSLLAHREAEILSGEPVIVQAVSPHYQMCIAARAAGVPVDLLELLPLNDYSLILTGVQGFLTVAGSGESPSE